MQKGFNLLSMKITILNGDMSTGASDLSTYIENLATQLRGNHSVDVFPLHKMKLHYCSGCWNCWWKTPGQCAKHDEAEPIFRSVINSDFVIFASPLMAGFTSSALKKITDRLIVLLHPYIQLKNGESHHRKRYDRYPDFGLLLQREPGTDEEDIQIVNTIYDRFALNFHNKRKYTRFIESADSNEIIHETTMNETVRQVDKAP
ncbi:NAD(P)H-dependent oxidoreductase [uncultured Bacteroides sp.]|uniref:NAD(P)H-dependent oxidoreductase n=1 Tax=uncultured Bacteroides sp. TaxID=162156 RepID=UPI002AA6C5C5|nr:NAD(P)H-dependent oxidoreductase [uncultured Bacteroides sp.]